MMVQSHDTCVRPMRILHLTAGSDAGGLSRYIYDVCEAMSAEGHDVAVAGERGAWHWLFEKAAWPWIDVPLKGGPLALWRAVRTLERWLEKHPVDVLHTHYRRATLVARLIQRRLNVPILYSVHLSDIAMNWPRNWLSDFGDYTHVASEQARRWVADVARIPPQRITMISHGVQTDRFPVVDESRRAAARHALVLPHHALVAAYVGRLDEPKNEDWLIDLADRTRTTLPDLIVLMAGEGPHEEQLRDRVRRYRLGDRVRMLGHHEPLPVYEASDALLLPSAREGFSLVTAEAMSVGIPVLRTNTAGAAELIVEGETGNAIPVDREKFIRASTVFLSDRDALRRMGANAARHIREHHTFDRQMRETIVLYRQMGNSAMAPATR